MSSCGGVVANVVVDVVAAVCTSNDVVGVVVVKV